MKNIIIATLAVVVLVFAFLFFTQKKSLVNYEPWPETEPATVKPTTNNNSPVQNNSTPTQTNPITSTENHSYTNSQFSFAVDLPGTEVTTMPRGNNKTFQFKKNGKLIATITPWSDSHFVDDMKNVGWTFVQNVNVNGQVFEQYHQSVDGSSGTTYVTTANGFTYQITTPGGSISDIFVF